VNVTLTAERLKPGDALPTRTHTPTNVSLFLYNAAVWNPHRIHYDEPYTTQVEGHPGIVIDGPLQGDWLAQCVLNCKERARRGDVARLRERAAASLSGGARPSRQPARLE
jgi:hydroxyacyl-ACP dehydratase HTD2-like protein with hotdog domain